MPGTADIEKKLRKLATTDLQVPKFSISGNHIFRILKTSENEHGLLQIAEKPAPNDPSPVNWETIFDVDGLNTAEGKKYELPPGSLADKLWASPGATRLLLSLSDGGSDVSELREFDVEQRAFVQDGFRTGTGRISFAWLDLDHILISHALTGGGVTRSNWPTTTYVWQRGTELSDARAIYSIPTTDVLSMLSSRGRPGSGRALILRVIDFQTFCRVIVSPDGSVHEVEMPRNQAMTVSQRHESHIVASLKSTAKFCGRDLPEGSLIAYDTSPGLHDDQRQSVIWVPEPGECAPFILTGGLAMTRSRVHLVVLKDGIQRRLVFRFTDRAWSIERSVLIEAGATPTIDDADSGSDDIIITDSGLLLPSMVQLERDDGTRLVFYQQPPAFDAGAFQVEPKSTRTLDGTASIDYIILSPKRAKGSNQSHGPVLMTGYGGFGITLPMQYLGQAFGGTSLIPWLEAGGSLVVPAIRGGGDRGPAWHEAARKEKRQKSYDDFAAVADRLVADGVATPGRIGVFGVSNGGLLSAVMGTQRPDLFGAVVSDVPLADMLRFTLMGMGAAWVDEYGDPADPAMAEVLRSYSPFHNVRDGGKYPPFLVTVSTKDDRVGAGHARKLAARLQDAGAEAYFSEQAEGGHGVSDPFRRAAFMARRVSFLIRNLS